MPTRICAYCGWPEAGESGMCYAAEHHKWVSPDYAPDERRPPSVLDDPEVKELARQRDGYRSQLEGRDKRIAELEEQVRKQRNDYNIRDRLLCDRIQKAETRIRALEAEGVPALIGQRNAWRDVAMRLHDILKNQDPSS